MTAIRKPVANPSLVFREEFDDWAVLFDPETGKAAGLNPVSAFIWKRLDGTNSEEDILRELIEAFEKVPSEAMDHLRTFLDDLEQRGFVGYDVDTA
jgi:SynChlorMet cassette protein ScmD